MPSILILLAYLALMGSWAWTQALRMNMFIDTLVPVRDSLWEITYLCRRWRVSESHLCSFIYRKLPGGRGEIREHPPPRYGLAVLFTSLCTSSTVLITYDNKLLNHEVHLFLHRFKPAHTSTSMDRSATSNHTSITDQWTTSNHRSTTNAASSGNKELHNRIIRWHGFSIHLSNETWYGSYRNSDTSPVMFEVS